MRTRKWLLGVPRNAFRVAVGLASPLGRSDDFNGDWHMAREAVVGRLVNSIEDFDYKKHGSGDQRDL